MTLILGGDSLFHNRKTPTINHGYEDGSPRRRALGRVRHCLWLSRFSFFFWSVFLSSVRSLLSFPFFIYLPLFPVLLALFAGWRWGGFIGQTGAGASLLPSYGSAWGAGLCCPATLPGWLASERCWQGAAPLTSHHQGAWGFESSAGHAARRN